MEHNISLIIQIVTLLGIVFGVFLFFRKPQEDLEKKQEVSERDTEGKAKLLAQQVQWEKEANAKKFEEFNCRLNEAMALAQNHIHSVDVKVDDLIKMVNLLNIEVGKLSTIINERLPKK